MSSIADYNGRRLLLSAKVGQAFYGQFLDLRPVQRAAIDPLQAGKDVLVVSRTGSGKTEAVVAPLVDSYLSDADLRPTGPSILYLTPTRALANDLQKRLEPPLQQLGLTFGLRHGERDDLARANKPHVLVTTPESLDVLLMARESSLSTVRAVLIDEVHLLYNSQRGFQTGVLLSRLERVAGRLQAAGLSATVARPEDLWAFLRPGRHVDVIADDGGRELDFALRHVDNPFGVARLLDRLAGVSGAKALVFVNSRRECDAVGAALAGHTAFGDRVYVHHSSLSKEQRLATEAAFASPGRAVCVATSTLELGIDIGDIDVVFLYGHPGGWESFLQRIGRGNRRSNTSNVVAIASSEHGSVPYLELAFEALVYQIRTGQLDREAPVTVYGAGLQQLLSAVLSRDGSYCRVKDLAMLFSDQPGYSEALVNEMVDHLVVSGFLRRHGYMNRVGPSDRLYRMRDLRMVWGNFPVRSREMQIHSSARSLGSVPALNGLRLSRGDVFAFGGAQWRIARIRPDRVDVERTTAGATVSLTFGGARPGLDPHAVNGILDYICSDAEPEGLAASDLRAFGQLLEELRGVISSDVVPLTVNGEGVHTYFTFGGRAVNEVIGAWIGDEYRAGDTYLQTKRPVDWKALPADPASLAKIAAKKITVPGDLTLFQTLLPERLLDMELSQMWIASRSSQETLARLRRATPVRTDAGALAALS